MLSLLAVQTGSLFPDTVVWALGWGQQLVNLKGSHTEGVLCSKAGLPRTLLVGATSYKEQRPVLCSVHSANLTANSLPSSCLPALQSALGIVHVERSCFVFPENGLGNCTVKFESVPVKQFDSLQRLKRDGGRSAGVAKQKPSSFVA